MSFYLYTSKKESDTSLSKLFTDLGWTRVPKLVKDMPLLNLLHIEVGDSARAFCKNDVNEYVPSVVASALYIPLWYSKDGIWCLLKNHPHIPYSWVIYKGIRNNKYTPICVATKSYYTIDSIKNSNRIIPFGPDKSYIIKPLNGMRQQNIYVATTKPDLINSITNINSNKEYKGAIVSKYIVNPYLIDGRKHHIRMNYIVSIINGQLYTFLCKLGYIYKAPKIYNPLELTDSDSVLSGVNINKYGATLLVFPDAYGRHAGKVFTQMKDILIDISVVSDKYISMYPDSLHGYCISGVDFMVDADMKVWFLEVNHNPGISLYPIQGHVALMSGVVDNILRKIFVLPKIKRKNYWVQLYGPDK